MKSGMIVEAKTKYGAFRIEAGVARDSGVEGYKDFERTFSWGDRCRVKAFLGERGNRWYGSCGIYSGALAIWPFYLPRYYLSKWTACKGIIRVVTEDKQLDFPTASTALEYLSKNDWRDIVYRNDGLAVSVSEPSVERMQINVDVIQILIRGKKPDSLPGADDGSIITFGK
jgi:hypothetical protein